MALFELTFTPYSYFSNRYTSGEAVGDAFAEVDKREVEPSGLKHSVRSAISTQFWHRVRRRFLKISHPVTHL